MGAIEHGQQDEQTSAPVTSATCIPRSLADFRAHLVALRSGYAETEARVSGARVLDVVLAKLDGLVRQAEEQEVGLQEAAELAGYSPDHLRRLAGSGRVPSYRDGRELRFRVKNLPRRVRPSTTNDKPHPREELDVAGDVALIRARRAIASR